MVRHEAEVGEVSMWCGRREERRNRKGKGEERMSEGEG